MSEPVPMLTLSQVMAKLAKEKGIHREFRMDQNGEVSLQDTDKVYHPTDLKILKSYRFEGDTNPDDSAVLYVLEDMGGNKGYIIDIYGAESNYPGDKFDEFLRDIPVDEQEEYDFDRKLE